MTNEPLRLQFAKQESAPALGAPASSAAPEAKAAAPKKAPKAKARPGGETSTRKKILNVITKSQY